MSILISILLWLPVAAFHIVAIIAGIIFIVPVGLKFGMPRLYRAGANVPWTYWEMAWRNPVSGFRWLVKHPDKYKTYGSAVEPKADGPRFQARFNNSGYLSSLRVIWRYTDFHYGEFYFGWKLGSEPPALDFGMSFPPICRWWARIGN